MPKVKTKVKSNRHNPLGEEIIDDRDRAGLRPTPRNEKRSLKSRNVDDDAEEALPAKVSQRVLQVAQAQAADEQDVASGPWGDFGGDDDVGMDDDEVEEVDIDVDDEGFINADGATEEEERALALFLPGAGRKAAPPGPTLADIILQKIEAHENRTTQEVTAADQAAVEEALSPKVIQVYNEIGKWMKNYKSGKIPKALKVIPSLTNWEEVLSLTNPLGWSPAAMYEVVAIFASNLNPRMAQRFYNLVLLPAVRQNIAEHKKLNFHYYRALRKALFKPAAFFKGVLLPLAVESCTLREALILGSVLGKASIPPMHSAATIARLSEMTPWYGTTSILLCTLINKKYALPLRVIEGLVAHFCSFARDGVALPVVWHRSLLIFVQRYKYDLGEDQRRRLRDLLKVHCHEAIGLEVRRELLAPKPGEATAVGAGAMETD
jgi:essential nuclear protein 1